MRKINPEHLDMVKRLLAETPYYDLLDMEVQEMREGYCRVTVDIKQKHRNAYGGFCGGAYASLLDMGAYYALYCELDEDQGYTTLDMTTHLLRSVSEGQVTCEGFVISRNLNVYLCKATVVDEKNRLLAEGTVKLFVSPTIQPMTASVAFLEPGAVLPPKFL